MHLIFYLRGKLEQVELWKAHAQSAYWKWRRINQKTGKEEITIVQGALRNSVMGAYEYIFPKEALTEVCSFFGLRFDDNEKSNYKFGNERMENAQMLVLRKIFQAKKIPKSVLRKAKTIPPTFTTEEFERGGSNCIIPGTAFHCIGIKEDEIRVSGNYLQECI